MLRRVIGSAASRVNSTVLRRSVSDLPSYIINAPATEITTLRNGVRVASEVSSITAVPTDITHPYICPNLSHISQ